MGLQKITFDGANVTSKIDADLYHFLFSKNVGVLNGLKNSVSYNLANNTITFQDGYVAIYGRLIYIESGTSISVAPDSSKYGYVVLGVNTSTNSLSIYNKEQVGTYPTLVITDLLLYDGLYEYPLCAYTKTTTSVTINASFNRSVIESNKEMIDKVKADLNKQITDLDTKYTYRKLGITKIDNGVFRFNLSYIEVESSLLNIFINDTISITISGASILEEIGSQKTVNYSYLGYNYSLFIEYSASTITLTCGSTNHFISLVYIYK